MKREKHHAKQRAPAAALIQSLWRLGASRSKESSTWARTAARSARPTARAATGKSLRNGLSAKQQQVELTEQMRGAIHSLRRLKYLASRDKFKFSLRPYDVRDVVESFGLGHAKLVTSVKELRKQVQTIEKTIIAFADKVEENRRRRAATAGSK